MSLCFRMVFMYVYSSFFYLPRVFDLLLIFSHNNGSLNMYVTMSIFGVSCNDRLYGKELLKENEEKATLRLYDTDLRLMSSIVTRGLCPAFGFIMPCSSSRLGLGCLEKKGIIKDICIIIRYCYGLMIQSNIKITLSYDFYPVLS